MPRGTSRIFREKYDGAAERLGISGATAKKVDSVFLARARGALKQQGFSVDGRNVSRIFQSNADLAQAELGLSPGQSFSIDFDGLAEALGNSTDQAIGLANVFTVVTVIKIEGFTDTGAIFDIDRAASPDNRITMSYGSSGEINALIQTQFNRYDFPLSGDLDAWIMLSLTWDGVNFLVFRNGVVVAPTVGTTTPAITMTDVNRKVGLGNNNPPLTLQALDGKMLWTGAWRTDLAAAAQLEIFANLSGIDLNVDGGNYASSADLAHWWRCGAEPSPNLGKDFATAGFTPTIDVEVNAVGITDADRVADVP